MPVTSYYLPVRARAEAHRMMLSYSNVPHEIVTVSLSDWGATKAAREICPFGQLPSLKMENGTMIAETGTITRYCAKLAGLYPSDPAAAAEADMIYELAQEQDVHVINPLVNGMWAKDSEDFKKNYAKHFDSLPGWLDHAQKLLGNKDFFGGTSPLFGDFGLYVNLDNSTFVKPDCLDAHPKIKAWMDRMTVLPGVQKYLKERLGPKTPGWVGMPGALIMSAK